MQNNSATTESQPYRWVILIVCSVILALTMGQLVNGLSAFVVPLETSEGWSRAEISLINTAGLVGLALGSLVMGFAAEKYGIRKIRIRFSSNTQKTTNQ